MITTIVYYIFELIIILLIISCFLTWIPNINREKQPFKALYILSELFLGPFRKIIPPIGMLDVSPIVALIVLGIVQTVVCEMLARIGL